MNSNLIQSDSEPHWRYTEVALNPVTHSIFAAVAIYLFSCCSMEGPKGDPHSGHTSSTFHLYINMCIPILEALYSNPRSPIAVSIIDGFHGAYYHGNWRALHHHAACWLVNIHISWPFALQLP